jgi:hypothetical protein
MNQTADALVPLGSSRACAVRPSLCRRRHRMVGSLYVEGWATRYSNQSTELNVRPGGEIREV